MKKITLIITLIFSAHLMLAQTYTTGVVNLTPGQTAQIDVTSTEVTLTMTGQDDRWLGLGFDATSMTSGKDAVIYDGTNLTDRTFIGVGSTPTLDATQSWSISSDNTNAGSRTIVATRSLAGDGVNDHVFTAAVGSIDLVYSNGNGPTFTPAYHGAGTTNRGIVPGNGITLGIKDFNQQPSFTISPNPSSDRMNIELRDGFQDARLQVYNVLGKTVLNEDLSNVHTSVDVTNWNSGIYIVRVTAINLSQTKRFVKQ